MAALLKNMTANNCTLTCLKREGDVALYQKTHKNGTPYGYEVVIIRTGRGKLEIYPDDEDFGTWGWAFNRRDRAEEFYKDMLRNRRS